MDNRRAHQRIKVSWPADLKFSAQPAITPARVKDISLKGCYIETSLDLAVGQKLLIRIHALLGQRPVILLAEAAVMRSTILAQMRGYGFGLALTKIGEQDKKMLERILGASAPLTADPTPDTEPPPEQSDDAAADVQPTSV